MNDVVTQEVSMTAEEFAEAVHKPITAAREEALSDEKNQAPRAIAGE
jgi:hypothetical protein